jgi:hypothetical protein
MAQKVISSPGRKGGGGNSNRESVEGVPYKGSTKRHGNTSLYFSWAQLMRLVMGRAGMKKPRIMSNEVTSVPTIRPQLSSTSCTSTAELLNFRMYFNRKDDI